MSDDDNLELRKKFIELLQKLTVNDTKDTSYTQLKNIIKENSNDKSLRVYLNSLMTFNTNSINAKERITILFGYIANIYRTNLLDPLDNPKSLIKTINRIVTHLRNNTFKTNDYIIQKACSYSILELLNLCMDKNDRDNLNKIFVEPFVYNIVNNSNAYVKNACCIYLNDLIFLIKDKSKSSLIIFDLIINENNFINDVILKINVNQYENEYLYECLYNLINFYEFEFFESKINAIIKKLLQILDKKNNLKPGTIINCVNILALLGKKMKKRKKQIDHLVSIIQLLTSYTSHRNKNVRESIKKALKILNNNIENNEEDKSSSTISDFVEPSFKKPNSKKYNVHNNINQLSKLTERRIQKYSIKNFNPIQTNNYFPNNNNVYDFKEEIKFDENMIKPTDYYNNKFSNKIFNFNDEINFEGKNLKPVNYNNNNNFINNRNFNVSTTEIEESENNEIKKPNENDYTFQMINTSDIIDKFNNIKTNLYDCEKKINSKLYRVENRLIRATNSIEENLYSIYKHHNNILDETLVDEEEKEDFITSLNYLNNNDYEQAFENILGDDIYLIRLLIISRSHLDDLKVSKELFKKIILRLSKIYKSHFIENILFNTIQYIDHDILTYDNNLLGNDLINTMNEIKQFKDESIQSKANFFTNLIYNLYNNKYN